MSADAASATDSASPGGGSDRLSRYLAVVAQFPPELRGPSLRQFLETRLDRLNALEDDHFAFLGECAVLAVHNMQDVRLQVLEARVEQLEEPDAPSWGETVTDIAVSVGIQIGVLLAFEGVAAYLIGIAGGRLLVEGVSKASARFELEDKAKSAAEEVLTKLQAEEAEATAALRFISSIQQSPYTSVKSPLLSVRISKDGEKVDVSTVAKLNEVISGLVHKREDALDKIELTQRTIAGAPSVDNLIAEYSKPSQDATATLWAGWRDLIGGEKSGPATSAAEMSLELLKPASLSQAGVGFSNVFLSSTVSGRYLNWVSDNRLRLAEEFSRARAYVRYTSDEQIAVADPRFGFLLAIVSECVPAWECLRTLSQGARTYLVAGLEAVFWFEYLKSNGLLVHTTREFDSANFPVPGKVQGNYLVLERTGAGDPGVHESKDAKPWTRVEDYPGAGKLSDHLAAYLFTKFASPFFAADVDALSPFEFDPARYADFQDQPEKDWLGNTNMVRVQMLNEMRHVVLKYFFAVPDLPRNSGIDELMRVTGVTGTDFRTLLAPDGLDNLFPPPTPPASSGEEFQDTVVAYEAARERDATVMAAVAKLEATINSIRIQQQNWTRLESGEIVVFGVPAGATSQDVAGQIKMLNEELSGRYRTLLDLVAEDSSLSASYMSQYGPTVTELANWEPTASQSPDPRLGESWQYAYPEESENP